MNKEILVNRLKLIDSISGPTDIPIELLYDEKAWRKGHRKIKIFDFLEEIHPPNEVFTKLRKLNKKPHPQFGVRKSLISKIKNHSKEIISPEEFANILEEGDGATLSNYSSLGTDNNIFSKLNEWYYGALGQRAFTLEGQVPSKFSNDSSINKANAKNLYNRAINGDFGKNTITIQKWGSGGLLDPVISFLDEIVNLDKKNGTNIYKKIRYFVTDTSKKSIRDSINDIKENKHAKVHFDSKVLKFKLLDATNNTSTNVANIESSYLYDSISSSIIAKVDRKFYELHYRLYLDVSYPDNFRLRNYDQITPINFKKLLENNDLKNLSNVNPRTFNSLRWDVKFSEIDIKDYPCGKTLEQMTKNVNNITLPTSINGLDSIKNALNTLAPNGYVQVFDLGIVDKLDKNVLLDDFKNKNIGDILRYNGAVYNMVNFYLIAEELKKEGFKVKLEHITNYLTNLLCERVLPAFILPKIIDNEELFNTLFPIEKMKNYKFIVETANNIFEKEGYSKRGKNQFYWKLREAELNKWQDNSHHNSNNNNDYIADYRESLRSFMHYSRALDNIPIWIFEKSSNKKLLETFDFLGFDKSIVKHLFKYHKEISEKLNYYHLYVQK